MFKNLSKTFKYVNEAGKSIVFEYASGFLINKPVGIDTVQVTLSRAQGINQVGATVQSQSVQPRAVNISGILVGEFQEQNKEKLLSVIRPDMPGKLYADDFYLNVYPTSTPTVGFTSQFANFQFALLAPYPYWQQDRSAKIVLSGLSYLFRLPANFTKPYKFAEVIETQFINVMNNGQLPAPFTATFLTRGSCVNPKITNAVTGEFMEIEKEMEPGEQIVVEITHERTSVYSSVEGDIRGALTLDSNLTRLQIGDNILKPDAEEGKNELEVTIDFATEKVGVFV